MANRAPKSAVDTPDILALLCSDHRHLMQLFAEFRRIKDHCTVEEKTALVQKICNALRLHAELEEEVFYPAVREILQDDMLMDEAESEHANAKDVVEELQALPATHCSYNAKVVVLGENVERHMREEETVVFPKVKKSRIDLLALADEMQTLRRVKQAQLSNWQGSPQRQPVPLQA